MDATTELLPLFPLGTVLLPGGPLPLRVFEPRYRELLSDVTAIGGRHRFGVVALTTGVEVETGLVDQVPEFAAVGTVAEILEVEPQPDGTSAVLTVGSSRFRILRLIDATTPYLQAEVEILDEPLGPLPETLPDAARALVAEYARLFGVLTRTEPELDPFPADAVALSYRIALEAPLEQTDRQALLEQTSATERLMTLTRLLRREVVLLRKTRTVAVSPTVLQAVLRAN